MSAAFGDQLFEQTDGLPARRLAGGDAVDKRKRRGGLRAFLGQSVHAEMLRPKLGEQLFTTHGETLRILRFAQCACGKRGQAVHLDAQGLGDIVRARRLTKVQVVANRAQLLR